MNSTEESRAKKAKYARDYRRLNPDKVKAKRKEYHTPERKKRDAQLKKARKEKTPLSEESLPRGFQAGNSRGVLKTEDERSDDRRLWLYKFAYKRRATRKGLEFKLSESEFLSIVKSECFYCEKSHLQETRVVNKIQVNMLTVDRLDSSLGYALENCVPACKRCNTIKMDLPFNDFLDHVRKIVNHFQDSLQE